ncbi:Peroxysomal citrate synthase [Favolaschia claudopus]|uniref:Peroxysomal citrate synthase n=1 Tax=Favolaschia claudopus TaxID=2862362 RepID=A0AAW0C407_9AGAR
MAAYDPRMIPANAFYNHQVPTSYSGAIGADGYPQKGYNLHTAAAQPYYPSPPPSYNTPTPPPSYSSPGYNSQLQDHHHSPPHAAYDPSYSPSQFVQPSLHSASYGFPTLPQSAHAQGQPSPLGRRNSVVDNAPRPRPPISDYSSLAGALDGSVGPSRNRSNSIHKHGAASPYKTPSRARCNSTVMADPEPMPMPRPHKGRRGSKQHTGPCLPDGPYDHVRLPQEPYQEPPVPESGYQRDNTRLHPIMFKSRNSATPGVRIADIQGEYCPTLEGATDIVFGNFSYRQANVKILWPGYPPVEKRIRTHELMQRGALLMLVATAVVQCIKSHAGKMLPPKRGLEAWTIGRHGHGGLSSEDVLITGLEHRGGANFQVEIWVPQRKVMANF